MASNRCTKRCGSSGASWPGSHTRHHLATFAFCKIVRGKKGKVSVRPTQPWCCCKKLAFLAKAPFLPQARHLSSFLEHPDMPVTGQSLAVRVFWPGWICPGSRARKACSSWCFSPTPTSSPWSRCSWLLLRRTGSGSPCSSLGHLLALVRRERERVRVAVAAIATAVAIAGVVVVTGSSSSSSMQTVAVVTAVMFLIVIIIVMVSWRLCGGSRW